MEPYPLYVGAAFLCDRAPVSHCPAPQHPLCQPGWFSSQSLSAAVSVQFDLPRPKMLGKKNSLLGCQIVPHKENFKATLSLADKPVLRTADAKKRTV